MKNRIHSAGSSNAVPHDEEECRIGPGEAVPKDEGCDAQRVQIACHVGALVVDGNGVKAAAGTDDHRSSVGFVSRREVGGEGGVYDVANDAIAAFADGSFLLCPVFRAW